MANRISRTTDIGDVVVLAADDSFAHSYSDMSALIRDVRANAERASTVEFFDATGQRLSPEYDRRGRLQGLQPTAESPDAAGVSRRLDRVARNIAGDLPGRPELAGRGLREQLAEFSHQLSPHPPAPRWWHPRTVVHADSGGYFHNLLHAAGWTHD